MASHSAFLDGLTAPEKSDLDKRLYDRQSGKCFICDNSIDLVVHQGQLEVDHIEPLAEGGADAENNFALVHSHCNRQKGASDLRVARRMAEFDRLQEEAKKAGERGANLGRVLARYGGAKFSLRLNEQQDQVRFAFSELDDISVRSSDLYKDTLSDMRYFFAFTLTSPPWCGKGSPQKPAHKPGSGQSSTPLCSGSPENPTDQFRR